MYRIHQIRLPVRADRGDIPDVIRKKLGRRDLVFKDLTVVRESVDARDKKNITRVFTVDFDCDARLDLETAPDMSYRYVRCGMPAKRPVVAGFGPCGMFCALIMAQTGMRPIVIERGKDADARAADVARVRNGEAPDPESNVQFGEGGAGTFSDGKLTTGIRDSRIRKVLEEFVAAGADNEILYRQRPHIGTDRLRGIIKNIRKEIIRLGGEVRFGTRLDDIVLEEADRGRRIKSAVLSDGTEIETDDLVLAVGHSARDTFRLLESRGFLMERKPFSIGVRIEHPQRVIDAAQYGDPGLADILGPAEYKLSYKASGGRGVYTFCMCPGGEVILASSGEGEIVTNGMSYHDRAGKYANSALLADVRPGDLGQGGALAGVGFQMRYERKAFELTGRYEIPETDYGSFRDSPVRACLPGFAAGAIEEAVPVFGRKIKGFDDPRAVMYAVETRSSSPVRILRGETYMSGTEGVYPAGEGAGYAGGIMSSAVDGIRIAESVARRYA